MTRGRPREGHPSDLALKNDNSIAKNACHLPSDIFGGPGFPVQVEARVKVLSLSIQFFLTQRDEKTDATSAKKQKNASRKPWFQKAMHQAEFNF